MMMPPQGSEVIVKKLNERGEEVWSYPGTVLRHIENGIVIEAYFERDEVTVEALHFERGDRMLETFYSDLWFNVFEVFEGNSSKRKGWYCNIARPARFEGTQILQEDLAIDLIVYPDFHTEVLDLDEFEALALDRSDREAALDALATLKALALQREPPFEG